MAKNWLDLFIEQVGKGEWMDAVKGAFPTKLKPNDLFTPAMSNVFRAFTLLKPSKVKYLVIGLDPYPNRDPKTLKDFATGVAFLVPEGVKQPTSLMNLRKGLFPADEPNLEKWSQDKGVLLINAALTIRREGKSGEHLADWKKFTVAVIRCVREKNPKAEIIALGVDAADVAKEALINCCIHPAAMNRDQNAYKAFWKAHGPLCEK